MKKILFALLAVTGFNYSSSAQSESKFAQNYKVCRGETGYQVCPKEGAGAAAIDNSRPYMAIEKAPVWRPISPCVTPTQVNVANRLRSTEAEQRQTPVNGVQNEGASQNAHRNINYGNNAPLSPNDGQVR